MWQHASEPKAKAANTAWPIFAIDQIGTFSVLYKL